MMIASVFINGSGYYAPPRVVSNEELSTRVNTSDEWIRTRTGIEQRHIIEAGQCSSDLGVKAAEKAIAAAGINADELTHIYVATFSPDAKCPSTACRLQEKLGVKGGVVIDVNAACSGFVYAMELAAGTLALRPESKILLVAVETLSLNCNWEDRSTCVLFGDGAGAVVLSNKKNSLRENNPLSLNAQLEAIKCDSDSSLGDLLACVGGCGAHPYTMGDIVGPEAFITMQGREVFKHAVRSMSKVCNELLAENTLSLDNIDVLIPHQANIRIINAVGERLNFPQEKVFVNVQRYGNTSAASIPLALSEAVEIGFIKPGMRVLLTTFGAGFTWGAAILKF